MSEVNHVELRGQVRIFKTGRSQATDTAWARASLRVGKTNVDVKAFKEAAEALGNAADLTVTVTGHLEREKESKDPEDKRWRLVVVVDRVQEHAPGERKGNAPKAQVVDEEIPF